MPNVRVTGLGCICAPGSSVNEAMMSIYSGKRNPSLPKRIKVDLQDSFPVFEIPETLDYDIEKITRTSYLAIRAAEEAAESSGLDRKELGRLRVGVCIGTTVGCTLNNEDFYRAYRASLNPDTKPIDRYLSNNPAQGVAERLGVNAGPVFCVVNACSSGTDAIGMAKSWIEKGICDVAIAGGADELSRITYLGFISLLIASKEPCRPFDKNRSGLNLGEGAGILVLERDDLVQKRLSSPYRSRGIRNFRGRVSSDCSPSRGRRARKGNQLRAQGRDRKSVV
jgi:3-oxoacyl-[acyl-carrier-protein] synthase II